jgi:hypothetical protein
LNFFGYAASARQSFTQFNSFTEIHKSSEMATQIIRAEHQNPIEISTDNSLKNEPDSRVLFALGFAICNPYSTSRIEA